MVFCDNAAGGDYGFGSDGYVRPDEALSTDPGTVFDRDRAVAVAEGWVSKIMISPAKKSPLGNAAVCTDSAGFEVEDENLFSDPRVVADGQFPGKMYVDPRLDDYAFAYLGTEKTKQTAFETGGPGKRTEEKDTLC